MGEAPVEVVKPSIEPDLSRVPDKAQLQQELQMPVREDRVASYVIALGQAKNTSLSSETSSISWMTLLALESRDMNAHELELAASRFQEQNGGPQAIKPT